MSSHWHSCFNFDVLSVIFRPFCQIPQKGKENTFFLYFTESPIEREGVGGGEGAEEEENENQKRHETFS